MKNNPIDKVIVNTFIQVANKATHDAEDVIIDYLSKNMVSYREVAECLDLTVGAVHLRYSKKVNARKATFDKYQAKAYAR